MATYKDRPNPDELLARIEAEEKPRTKGRLKIFLGYAAGVGKTYTMLEAARQRMAEPDIVVAYVETHGRVETEALLQGLEIIPRRKATYRGVTLTEMDIDATLKRHPRLALVDELAHTNIPNSRHPKRYQDVEELLEAGIDVYTTLNVQHVEGLQNIVAQVTSVWVRETVPDNIINAADEIEVVDLPPDELLRRLKEGKVYIPDQARRATEDFFRKGNLLALRELTMRTAALRVNEQMRDYMEKHSIPGPWLTTERLLVCVSPNVLGNQLVRTARRLASQLRAEWFVVFVEMQGHAQLSLDQQDRLTNIFRQAERFGAKTVTIQGSSIASAIADFARTNSITKLVIGKPQRTGWRKLFKGSVLNEIIQQSSNYDIYIVNAQAIQLERAQRLGKKEPGYWLHYLEGLALVALATLLGQLARDVFSPINVLMIYLLCVAIASVFWGFGPSILTAILAVLAYDFFLTTPDLSFDLSDPQYIFTFIIFLMVGLIVSYLTTRVRLRNEAARQRERQTAALYALGKDLAALNDLESYIQAIVQRIKETIAREAVILLPENPKSEKLKPYPEKANFNLDEHEYAAALWSFQHQKMVGHGTDTLPNAKATYVPLVTGRGTIGIMALWSADSLSEITLEQDRLLEAYADLAAAAIEGLLLSKKSQQA